MSHGRALAAIALAAGLGLAAPGAPTAAADLDSAMLGGLEARAIGPAVMSGRVAGMDVARDEDGKLVMYVAAASGGLWKSVDGGVRFEPVFDDHIQSVGAVEIDPTDPETVWAGTGESWVRNSVSIGRGVYKSTDGGDEWTLMGLGDTERISRIRIHPEDGDVVWVCATGHLFDANEQRGVFKTTDGGRTWDKVLYVDEDTGCADIDIDPQAPDIVYAAMWQYRRYPDRFVSGGPGSGLYKSTDGGETWTELTNGLPEGEKGRIAVAVSPSRPNRLYATVEADETALYRSDDLGSSWERVNDSSSVSTRPFYFSHLVIDPTDHTTVYKPGQFLAISTDGGESFTSFLSGGFGGFVHPDHHALWIDPEDPRHLVLGTDGGVYVSYDQGHTFRMVGSLPISQFYEVSVDMEWPYNVYGGLQDNGSWMGPSRSPSGIENRDWESVGSGDGFHTYRDPNDPDFVYSEYQGGQIHRRHLQTGEMREIKPYPAEGEPEYRFNWNTPVAFSPHPGPEGGGAIYLGAQRLLRSDDHGSSWRVISPDLTTNNPEWQRQEESGGLTIDNSTAENHTTIYTISESPVEEGVIWVGTDDGNVQVTRDGGETWTNVASGLRSAGDLPERTWISEVFASPHAAGTAFVTVDGHYVGDMSTHVFRTTDYGATWTSLAKEPLEGFAHAIEQDPVNPDLLYLGTELGLWISLDGGEQWVRFEGGMPKMVPVRDVTVHPRDGDLVIATHGRGIYILDDLTPLRNLTREVLDRPVALLPTRDAWMVIPSPQQQFGGQEDYVGPNPAEAAYIAYYMARRHLFGDLRVEIYDQDGELIKSVPGSKRRGVNRVTWPMRLPPPKVPPATNLVPAFEGPRVLEGTYTVKLIKGDETVTGEIELVPDPRSPHSAEDRRLQQTTALELYEMLERLTYLIDATVDLRDQARSRAEGLPERNRTRRELEEYADGLESLRASLVSTSESGMLSGDEKLREEIGALYGGVNGYTGRPNDSQLDRVEILSGRLDGAFGRFEELAARRQDLDRSLSREGLEPLELLSPEAWEERDP